MWPRQGHGKAGATRIWRARLIKAIQVLGKRRGTLAPLEGLALQLGVESGQKIRCGRDMLQAPLLKACTVCSLIDFSTLFIAANAFPEGPMKQAGTTSLPLGRKRVQCYCIKSGTERGNEVLSQSQVHPDETLDDLLMNSSSDPKHRLSLAVAHE